MKLFEAYYRNDKNYYVRYFNTETQQTETKLILEKGEAFVENPRGKYSYILDSRIKLTPRVGYTNQRTYGETGAGLVHIRNNYWKFEGSNYNINPSIFYLDIETTSHAPVDILNTRERIVSIQIYHNLTNTNIFLGLEDFDVEKHTENGKYKFDNRVFDFKLKYIKLKNEAEILSAYFKLVEALKPLFVIAHNGCGFDFKYLWSRCEKNGIKEGFSPYGKSFLKDKSLENGKQFFDIDAPGIFYMDSIDIYKRFRLVPRASYSLDSLAEVELNERKVSHDCFSTFDGFRTGKGYIRPEKEPNKESTLEYLLYHAKSQEEVEKISKEWFIHYSIIDTFLLYKIDDTLKLTKIMLKLSSIMGINPCNSLGTVGPWGNYIKNYCFSKGIILPPWKENQQETPVIGGFVKEPIPGKYDWVYSMDVTSMYPSQIMAFNMSAEKYIPPYKLPYDLKNEISNLDLSVDEQHHLKEYFENPKKYERFSNLLKKYNYCGSLNGAIFDKSEKGIIPVLVEHVFKQRKEAKKEMLKYEKLYEETKNNDYLTKALELDIEQNALKIAINGLYGALGNPVFVLFNEAIANAITGNSRFYVQLFSKNVEVLKNNNCYYNDTDSSYLGVPKEFIDSITNRDIQEKINKIDEYIENEIQPVINNSSKELGDIFNALDSSKISAKREVIAEKAVFIAKKRYIMKIWDSEGIRFEEPHLKTMGIDLVRSSTPLFSKRHLKESIKIMLESTETQILEYISSIKEEFKNADLTDIAKVATAASLNYDLKNDKGIPIGSRACLVSNQYIQKHFSNEFNKLQPGEKFKMLYLKTPNPLNADIFAFDNEKFAQKFKDFVDYDKNFDKFFLKPLEIMTIPLKFNVYKNSETLDVW